jgi:hypothetical protein
VVDTVKVFGAGPTAMDSAWVAVWGGPPESVTSTVKSEVPGEVGVPEISPDDVSRLIPPGRLPRESDHV